MTINTELLRLYSSPQHLSNKMISTFNTNSNTQTAIANKQTVKLNSKILVHFFTHILKCFKIATKLIHNRHYCNYRYELLTHLTFVNVGDICPFRTMVRAHGWSACELFMSFSYDWRDVNQSYSLFGCSFVALWLLVRCSLVARSLRKHINKN